jgi:YidC/Oxa1 family membrane protein insertase
MNEQRNLVVAIGLSILILIGFQVFYETPRVKQQQAEQAVPRQTQSEAQTPGAAPAAAVSVPGSAAGVPTGAAPVPVVRERAAVLGEQLGAGNRIRIDTPRLKGSIARTGARLDDLTLADYHLTPDPASPGIVLLSPSGTEKPYYAEFGWVPEERSVPVPDSATVWAASGDTVTPGKPVTLSWDNGQGLVFEKQIGVDDNYMFQVTERVRNTGDKPVTLLPYGLVSRHGTPETAGFYILHEGPLGVLDGTLNEVKYKDLREKGAIQKTSTGGWLGMTDKYWLVSLVPDQQAPVTARFLYTQRQGEDRYQADILGEARTVAPGASTSAATRLFAGAKEVRLLDRYDSDLGIAKFDLAIDFGWFYFLTKPFFYALILLHKIVGNFGIAILLFTVVVKGLFYPLADKSYRSMSKMKQLQPEIVRLRERYGDDKERINKEMIELYKREKVNPLSGCLPVFIQIPVFFALYKVLFVTIEMRHAPFFGWIHDLSSPDPTNLFTAFGMIPWSPPQMLTIGLWPLVMGFTMWLQQKLNPAPADPTQQKIFQFLPLIFTFMLANFPAGLVIYWAWNNTLSIAQQWLIMRKMGVKVS